MYLGNLQQELKKVRVGLQEISERKDIPDEVIKKIISYDMDLEYFEDSVKKITKFFFPEDKSLMAKFIERINRIAKSQGVEMRQDREMSNPAKGDLFIQETNSFKTIVKIKYDFSNSKVNIYIFVQSQCKNSLNTDDSEQLNAFLAEVEQTIEIAVKEEILK